MSFLKTLWADLIYDDLYEDPELNSLFNRSYEQIARQGGNKITLQVLGTGASIQQTDNKSIGSGLPLTIKDIDKDGLDIELHEYTSDPILIRNVDVLQANRDLLKDSTEEIRMKFKEHIMNSTAKHIIENVDATHKLKWLNNDTFSARDLAKMKTRLGKSKILANNRFALMDAEDTEELYFENNLKDFLAVQQKNLLAGEFPTLFNFGLTESTLVPLSKADGTISSTPAENIYRNVIGWRKKHMHLVIQADMKITGSERAEFVGYVASFSITYGIKLERSKGGVICTQQAAA